MRHNQLISRAAGLPKASSWSAAPASSESLAHRPPKGAHVPIKLCHWCINPTQKDSAHCRLQAAPVNTFAVCYDSTNTTPGCGILCVFGAAQPWARLKGCQAGGRRLQAAPVTTLQSPSQPHATSSCAAGILCVFCIAQPSMTQRLPTAGSTCQHPALSWNRAEAASGCGILCVFGVAQPSRTVQDGAAGCNRDLEGPSKAAVAGGVTGQAGAFNCVHILEDCLLPTLQPP